MSGGKRRVEGRSCGMNEKRVKRGGWRKGDVVGKEERNGASQEILHRQIRVDDPRAGGNRSITLNQVQ